MSIILVPVDGSEASLRALRFAITAAQRANDQIFVLNVQPSFRTPNMQRFFSQENIQSYQQELSREALSEAIELLKGMQVPYEEQLRIGAPAQEICRAAEELNASYIVMGSRGAGVVKGKLLGSVSYGVLHEAPCPVTIVR